MTMRMDFFKPLLAKFRPMADVVLFGGHVQIRLGNQVLISPFPDTGDSLQSAGQAVTALVSMLDKSARRIGRLRLIASDRWLRPLLILLKEESLGDAEIEVILLHQYRELYGPSMSEWGIRWVRQANDLVLAMAWPNALLGLRAMLLERGIRQVSAVPYSLLAICSLPRLPESAWIVVVEASCITLIRLSQKGWRQCRVLDVKDATAALVSSQLLRMVAQTDDECRCAWVVLPEDSREESDWSESLLALLHGTGWQVHLERLKA